MNDYCKQNMEMCLQEKIETKILWEMKWKQNIKLD